MNEKIKASLDDRDLTVERFVAESEEAGMRINTLKSQLENGQQ